MKEFRTVVISDVELHNIVDYVREKGVIFSATFIKKDGSLRRMNCRVGVRKYVKGVGMSYNPIERDLLPVYDLVNRGYRTVNLKTVKSVRLGNVEYVTE